MDVIQAYTSDIIDNQVRYYFDPFLPQYEKRHTFAEK